jgi:hypothetical protein
MTRQLFALGQVAATPGALALVPDVIPYIRRHAAGDFGTCGQYAEIDLTAAEARAGAFATGDDGRLNVHAIRYGGRVLSAYDVPGGRLWVMTDGLEAGGNAGEDTYTTALLPDEN